MAGFSSAEDFDLDTIASMWQLNPDQADCLQSDKKLANLIQELNNHISSRSAVTLRKEKQLQTAKEWYNRSKEVYLQNLIVYNEIKKILTESQRCETSDVDVLESVSGFAALERTLTTSAVRSKRTDRENECFGLDDKHFDTPTVRECDANELRLQLEVRLLEMMSEFTEHYNSMTGNVDEDEQQQMGETLMLHSIIERDTQKLDDRNEYLDEITAKCQSLTVNYSKAMQESAHVLADLSKFFLSYDLDENKLNVLTVKMKTLLLKMRVFKLEVQIQTYPAKTVKAHQKISDHLKDSLAEATSKKLFAEQQLSVIKSIGSEFSCLADEYGRVLQDIETKEWMLRKLREK